MKNKDEYTELEIFGFINENIVYNQLIKILNNNLKMSLFRYSPFDFYDENGNIFELKTRKYRKNDFKTSVIDKFKIIKNRYYPFLYFIFNYINITDNTNELYYIKYDYNKFKLYHTDMYNNIHIPIEDLILLNENTDTSIFKQLNISHIQEFNFLIRTDYINSKR